MGGGFAAGLVKLGVLLSRILIILLRLARVSQALQCVAALVSQKCPDHVALAALEFLASLGKVFLPHDSQVWY